MKKLKGALLSLVLCLCLIVPVFAFVGCGGADPETVGNSLNDLAGVFEKNSAVFVEGYIDNPISEKEETETVENGQNVTANVIVKYVDEQSGIKTKYKVNYGENLNKAVNDDMIAGSDKKLGYEELNRKYNVIFAYANEFIDTYKIYLPTQEDREKGELSDETNKALDAMNNGIKEYIESIDEFIKQKNIAGNYYNTTDFSVTTGLRAFERSYGKMIEKAVNVSNALADVLEYNNIINYVKDYNATSDRTMIIEGFVRAKLLPVYSNFMLSEIKNKIWWETTNDKDGVTKNQITSLIEKIEGSFNTFKGYVKSATVTEDKTDVDIFEAVELKPLVENLVNVFVVDAEQYNTALTELNIQKLSVDYKNDMGKYMKESNAFAKNYLNKIEDFLTLILDNFQNDFYGQVLK